MANMPDIRPEVNKDPEDNKKKAAGLAGLLGGGGAGGGGALGALGGGGMLASKSGLLALALVGTTVAGGVGVVGYRLFGPGESERMSGQFSLFAAKPKSDAAGAAGGASAGLAPAAKDGSSQSLQFLAQANAPAPVAPGAAADGAPSDASAGDAAKDAAAASGSAKMGESATSADGKAASFTPKNTLGKKFGELSKGFGGSAGSVTVGAGGAGAGAAQNASAAAGKSSLGALGASRGRSSAAGRSIAGRNASRSAMRNLMDVRRDLRGAQTSYGAGRTYDGSAARTGDVAGPGAGAIGVDGPGVGNQAQPKESPNSAIQKKELEAPPTPTAKEVTPWKKAITTAQMLLGIGGILLFAIGQIKVPMIRYALAALVAALGAAVIAMGAQVSGGKYGQKAQGGILAAAGLGLVAAAALAAMSTSDNTTTKTEKVSISDDNGSGFKDVTSSEVDLAKEGKGGILGMNPYVLMGGGAALMGTIGTMMMPPKKYPSTDFKNGKPPDGGFFGHVHPKGGAPSDRALAEYLSERRV